jgi:outer membrane protein OmpA-like peptidoglycan-associated protein
MNAVTARRGTIVYENLASGYFTARVAEPGGTWWITVGRTSGMGTTELYGYKVETIREAAMAQAVTLDAAALGRGLAAEGRVVLDGLRFATDQATILPESQPVLVQMAAWLTANPTVSVFIVGHTDAQGTLEHNRTLSRARAAAVVAALVGSHGIAAARLTADGVGPVAPVASNATDAGRARNRRVELVLR